MSPAGDWTHCFVLTAPGEAVADALRAQMAARRWQIEHRQDPYLTMAELCLDEVAQRTRAAWGLKRVEQSSLVIVPPGDGTLREELGAITAAVRRYLPRTPICRFVDGHLETLYDETEQSEEAPGAERPAPAEEPQAEAIAQLPRRLQTAPTPSPPSSTAEPKGMWAFGSENALEEEEDPEEASIRPHLSREEIDMLLGADEAEERP